jgi:type VI protein secretion system component VasK
MSKYLRLAARLTTCVMVVALWAVGLWILLPLAKGMHETGTVLLGLALLTLVHGGFMLSDLLSEKKAHHKERLKQGPGSHEQVEAHQRDAAATGRLELAALVVTLTSVVCLIIFRFAVT